jgi:adenine-specific DNA methylase
LKNIAETEKHSLIDDWFPITEASIESIRERSASSALPPLYFLHVWFARRPLAASRAAILTTVLPAKTNKKRVLRLLGVPPDKDIAGAAKLLEDAKAQKRKLSTNPFSWERAFKHVPSIDESTWLVDELKSYWGSQIPTILDPMAGGGSIPLEAVRLGLPAIAGDLNPISYVVLKATIEYPTKFGPRLVPAVRQFCQRVHEAARKDLEDFYPKSDNQKIYAYLWSRTVKCQHCGLSIPLSPNWWISKNDGIAAKPTVRGNSCSFQIIKNPATIGFDPDGEATDVGKDARCIRCGKVNDGEYVKAEARDGRMGHQLITVCTKHKVGRSLKWDFRAPSDEEIAAAKRAERELEAKLPLWEKHYLVPIERFPDQYFDTRPVQYGMPRWCDLFNPRQLLAHLTYLEKFEEATRELLDGVKRDTEAFEFAKATVVYGAIVFNTCVDYNCLLSLWHSKRLRISHAMALQAFPFMTSYAEWDHPNMLWPWAQTKVLDLSLTELIRLLPDKRSIPRVFCGDAAQMSHLEDKSIDVIVVDPPYAENVMYGEVMDFFYVWMKRTLGDVFPNEFKSELAETREEAVANASMFRGIGGGMAKKLADQHYQSKMEACFKEMQRVLRDDGLMTVMFTHRKAEAWAGLATSLMKAGFTFRASWPVFTEPGEKFGKREKGVLKVTVLLASQKRLIDKRGLWEEVQKELYEEAEKKVKEHSKVGISGPDLLVSTYGPVLGKFADYAVVKDATGKVRGPEDALSIVAEVVNKFLTADLPSADLETVAYLNLVRNFPYLETEIDFARVVTVFGGNVSLDALDIKGGRGLVEKKGNKVKILSALDRVERGIIKPTRIETLRSLIDVVHASLIIYEKMGVQPVKNLLVETGRDSSDAGFLGVLRVIAQLGSNGDAAEALVDESRTANALLEALGHQPETLHRKGESLTHYFES